MPATLLRPETNLSNQKRTAERSAMQAIKTRISGGSAAIKAEFVEGLLLLSGCVANFHTKQLAQESVRRIAGVEQIKNQIRVVRN
jgi:osmotically-inducible protein OsmY